jgi:hypothetical protein
MGSLFSTPKIPKAPKPEAVAESQFKANTQSGQQQAAFNRVNQQDAFGNTLNYAQTGTDAQGNPIYSANQGLGGLGQQYSQGLSGLGNQYFSQAGNVGNLGSQDAFDKAYSYATANLEPRFQRSTAALESKLRNQGLDPTSEAYKSAMNDSALQQNEARNSLVTGLQGQMFNQGLQQRQQGMSELQPGMLFANNVLNPSYAQVPGVNIINPDMAGIQNQNFQNQMARYNAQAAQQSAMLGGLASIGGAIAAPFTGGASLGMIGGGGLPWA